MKKKLNFQKKSKKQNENYIWNQRQKLHYLRKFHQNQTSCVEGRRSNVDFLVKIKIFEKSKKMKKKKIFKKIMDIWNQHAKLNLLM